jgi:hypothetical protein
VSLQKSIIFGLALIAAVACDVSHLQGQGWSKDESGYKYPKPAAKFDPAPEVVEEEIVQDTPELEIIADEPVGVSELTFWDHRHQFIISISYLVR